MMKKPIQKLSRTLPPLRQSAEDVELRRWCIERAVVWPTYTSHLHGALGLVGQLQQGHTSQSDHDVIARAEKILQWVTK